MYLSIPVELNVLGCIPKAISIKNYSSFLIVGLDAGLKNLGNVSKISLKRNL
jgi:hypothetical protein